MPFTYVRDSENPWAVRRHDFEAGAFERYDHALGAWVEDDDLPQMGLDEYYEFERVTEAEALAAIARHEEELAATGQGAPKPEKRPQWGQPQWKRFFCDGCDIR